MPVVFCLRESKRSTNSPTNRDVTNTRNGERGTGNGGPGPGVWERVYSGNPPDNSKWRRKEKNEGSVTVVKGGGQNTDPQSMDYPNGLP